MVFIVDVFFEGLDFVFFFDLMCDVKVIKVFYVVC